MAILGITGAIKNINLPFVINSGKYQNINLSKVESNDDETLKNLMQLFSFKAESKTIDSCKLNICPKTFNDVITRDISLKSLYKFEITDTKNKENITLSDILNVLPGIQIREFLPDSKLDQCINVLMSLFKTVLTGYNLIKSSFSSDTQESDTKKSNTSSESSTNISFESITANLKNFGSKFASLSEDFLKFLAGKSDYTLYNIFDSVKNSNSDFLNYNDNFNKYRRYLLDFPNTMWYKLQSCTTMNIYELPYVSTDNLMYNADGSPGWPSAGLSLMKSLDTLGGISNIPILSQIVNSILGNINISMMPWWNGAEGNGTPSPSITVKLPLFNDTAESAINNFIFVNTLIPNAKWMQYNIFQHSPCLYDIKIDGYTRLYACTGKFKVTSQGVLRKMPKSWLLELCNKHVNPLLFINPSGNTNLVNLFNDNNIIKIPDIYIVDLTFDSLLPDNFNNFLFQYVNNKNIVNNIEHAREDGSLVNSIDSFNNKIEEYVKTKTSKTETSKS